MLIFSLYIYSYIQLINKKSETEKYFLHTTKNLLEVIEERTSTFKLLLIKKSYSQVKGIHVQS
jgi:hypothetical protein